jgi:hypothetical protein
MVGLGRLVLFVPSKRSCVKVHQSPPGSVRNRPLIVAGDDGSVLVMVIGAADWPPCESETSPVNVPEERQPVWPGVSAFASRWTVENGAVADPALASEPLVAAS